MDTQGGGTYILRRMCQYAADYGVVYQFAYDVNGEGVYPSETYPSVSFQSRRRQYRWGLGRLVGFLTLTGFDPYAERQLQRIIDDFNPDAIHLTAHGVSFPLMAKVAFRSGIPVYLSVHDAWQQTVRPYAPKGMANWRFGNIARRAKEVFVISDEMGRYLKEAFGLEHWLVVHDGVTQVPERSWPGGTSGIIRLLYVGIVHSRQMKTLHQMVRCLGHFPDRKFEVHFCTRTPYTPEFNPANVDIIFHGWLAEEQLVALSQNSHFGLLPLSFNAADALFYRTSFMTKVPFYTGVKLPMLCIGPSWTSAMRTVREDGLGLIIETNDDGAVEHGIRQMVEMTPERYQQYLHNMARAARTRFDVQAIAERFYNAMGCCQLVSGQQQMQATTKDATGQHS